MTGYGALLVGGRLRAGTRGVTLNRPLSNIDIDNIMYNRKYINHYKGIAFLNKLSKVDLSRSGDFVFIFHKYKYRDMGHWTIFIKYTNGFIHFNSEGYRPEDIEVLKYIKKYDTINLTESQEIYNMDDYQADESQLCGYYCIWVIDQLLMSKSRNYAKLFRNICKSLKIENFNTNHSILYDYFRDMV